MQRVEQEQGRLLENLLPERINDVGLTDTAQELGISKATLGYWLLKMNIQVKRVALRPGESIEITRQIER